ncbi:MAG TPA: TonB-dependent receptor plug domain-containing protein, partial [Myxococcota bacterium]|nr:TonB-dependent receptor plug domain-containing protein [Myxococcota bacterium]
MTSSTGLRAISAALAIGFLPRLAGAQAAPQAEPAPQSEGLEEIVVTATKRAQDVQDVPIAISALSGDDLIDRNITNTMDLMGALPNLQVTTAYGKTQPNFALRGISVANEFNSTTASPVGVYVDEVYQSLRASHGGQLFDLERIEVVRGPQGTLFGRNTTGGAVNFFTKKPALGEINGEISAGYANYDTWRVSGAAEFTLIEDVL